MKQGIAITCIVLLLGTGVLPAQSFDYGHDWYTADTGRPFIKLQLWETGVYRVYESDFVQAGYDLSGVDPDHLQVFYRGEEQPVHLVKTPAGALHYFDFYGIRNDGRVDSLMYRDAFSGLLPLVEVQPQKELSLFTDTSAYFLTWTGQNGLRYDTYHETDYTGYLPQANYPFRSVQEFYPLNSPLGHSIGVGPFYSTRYILNVDYTVGEGYIGPAFHTGYSTTLQLPTPQADHASPFDIVLAARILGASDSVHSMDIRLPQLGTGTPLIYRYGIQVETHTFTFPQVNLPASTSIQFNAYMPNEKNNICGVSLRYLRLCHLDGQAATVIDRWAGSQKAYFAFEQASGTDSVFAFSLKNQLRIGGLIDTVSGTARIIVPPFSTPDDLRLVTELGLRSPVIRPNHSLANLCDPANRGDFLIITHRSLAASAMAYAAYRDSFSHHPLEARVVFTDEIYDEFGYGSFTPWAIKRFIKCATDHWENPPQYVLLWGKSRFPARPRTSQTLVPTMGYPYSDLHFVSQFDPTVAGDIVPVAAIGRVSVENDAEGMAYLGKVQVYEASPQPGSQRSIFLGGSVWPGEQAQIDSILLDHQARFAQSPLQGVSFYYYLEDTMVSSNTPLNYAAALEKDIAVQFFMGHSTSRLSDIQLVSDSTIYSAPGFYDNEGKYPLLVSMGAYLGDFTNTGKSLSEEWLLEPQGGAIGVLASASGMGRDSIFSIWGTYTHYLTNQLFYDARDEPLGKIVMETLRAIQDSVTRQSVINTARQVNLQGDPAIRMKWVSRPTSIAPGQRGIALRIFPNPAQDELIVESPALLPATTRFRLLDGQGRVVPIQPLASPGPQWRTSIALGHLAPGMYYLSIATAGGAVHGYPVQIMRP